MARIQLASLGAGVDQYQSGAVHPFAAGTITLQGTSTPVTIWSDREGGSGTPGTFTTDTLGRIPGWVDRQSVDYEIDITIPPAEPVTVLIPGTAGGVIQDGDGAALPPEPALQFTGSGVTVADDAVNARTVVTVSGGGGGGGGPLNGALGMQRIEATGLPVTIAPNATTTVTLPVSINPEQYLGSEYHPTLVLGLIVELADISKLAVTLTDADGDEARIFIANDFQSGEADIGDITRPGDPDSYIYFVDSARGAFKAGAALNLLSAGAGVPLQPADALRDFISRDDAGPGPMTVSFVESGGNTGTVHGLVFFIGSTQWSALTTKQDERLGYQLGAARGVAGASGFPKQIQPNGNTIVWPGSPTDTVLSQNGTPDTPRYVVGIAFSHPHPEGLEAWLGSAKLFDAGDLNASDGTQFGGSNGLTPADLGDSMLWFADFAGTDFRRRRGVISPKTPLTSPGALVITDTSGSAGSVWFAAVLSVNTQWEALALSRPPRIAGRPITTGTSAFVRHEDYGGCLDINVSSAFQVQVQADSMAPSVPPVGGWVEICQVGTGQVEVVLYGGTGTLLSPGGLTKTRAQYSTIRVRRQAKDVFVLSGDLGS